MIYNEQLKGCVQYLCILLINHHRVQRSLEGCSVEGCQVDMGDVTIVGSLGDNEQQSIINVTCNNHHHQSTFDTETRTPQLTFILHQIGIGFIRGIFYIVHHH